LRSIWLPRPPAPAFTPFLRYKTGWPHSHFSFQFAKYQTLLIVPKYELLPKKYYAKLIAVHQAIPVIKLHSNNKQKKGAGCTDVGGRPSRRFFIGQSAGACADHRMTGNPCGFRVPGYSIAFKEFIVSKQSMPLAASALAAPPLSGASRKFAGVPARSPDRAAGSPRFHSCRPELS
jgi:hypothetical protein